MANVLTIGADRSASLAPADIAVQNDALVALTISIDKDVYALFGTSPQAWVDFERADGTSAYIGPFALTDTEGTPDDVETTIPASVLSVKGTLRMQLRVSDDDGLAWHSLQTFTTLPEAIEATTPATDDDHRYAEVPATYVEGNLLSYDPTSGRLVDTGISVADLQALLAS